jgi:hypothetical protein
MASAETTFAERYPNIALWVKEYGWVELGYDYNTDTCARAIDEGGMPWGGGNHSETVEDWLQALERGIKEFLDG